jgi:predicted RNA-binding Zn-ribbon protein involved in translation (DUF1610 family)
MIRGEGLGIGGRRQGLGYNYKCFCPKCGYEGVHQSGVPCSVYKCPKCGTKMTGKR